MNITKQDTDKLLAEITISLQPEDYKDLVTQELKRQARTASLPGFRPGKVPLNVVRKMVGKSVVVDQVSRQLSENLNKYLQEQPFKILGEPMPKSQVDEDYFDEYCEKELEFTYEIGLAPSFELKMPESGQFPLYQIEMDDAFLDKEIERHRDRLGKVSNPEEVGEGDIIYGKLYESDTEGQLIEDGFEQMVALNPARIDNKDLFKSYHGKKVGDTQKLDLSALAEDDETLAKLTFIEADELPELRKKNLQFEIRKVNRVELADLDKEFFTRVLEDLRVDKETAGAVEDEAAFRTALIEPITKDLKESATWYYRNKVQEALMEENAMDFPEDFLKKWLIASKEDYTDEKAESELPEMMKSLQWSLIVEKLQDENPSLVIEAEDLKNGIRESVKESITSMGLDPASEDDFVNHMMQNQEVLDSHYRRMLNDRIYGYLEEKVAPKEEQIEASKFVEMLK